MTLGFFDKIFRARTTKLKKIGSRHIGIQKTRMTNGHPRYFKSHHYLIPNFLRISLGIAFL